MHAEPILLVWAYIVAMTIAVAMLERWRRQDERAASPPPLMIEGPEEDDVADYVQEILPLQVKAHPDLITDIQKTARRLAAGGREICSDDVIEAVHIPLGVDPRVMGCAFQPRGDWERVGYKPSRIPRRNKRPVSVWRLRASSSPRPS